MCASNLHVVWTETRGNHESTQNNNTNFLFHSCSSHIPRGKLRSQHDGSSSGHEERARRLCWLSLNRVSGRRSFFAFANPTLWWLILSVEHYTMSRQPATAQMGPNQAEPEEEEVISGAGEGDEIMEEAEEQEGYSAYSCPCINILYGLRVFTLILINHYVLDHNEWLTGRSDPHCSVIHPDVDADLDQLVLLPSRTRVFLRSLRGVHRGRLQLDRPQCDGTLLERGHGYGAGRRARYPSASITCNPMWLMLTPSDEDASKIPDVSIVESSAEMLYGLVHQRFILTRAGLQAMVNFFSCFRWYARVDGQHLYHRWRSTRMQRSGHAHVFIALAQTSFPVEDMTCQVLTL
jgi:hypothetical protein